eukprot:jgi/Botrbrau1/21356/Bobra.0184s0065.1
MQCLFRLTIGCLSRLFPRAHAGVVVKRPSREHEATKPHLNFPSRGIPTPRQAGRQTSDSPPPLISFCPSRQTRYPPPLQSRPAPGPHPCQMSVTPQMSLAQESPASASFLALAPLQGKLCLTNSGEFGQMWGTYKIVHLCFGSYGRFYCFMRTLGYELYTLELVSITKTTK